MLSVRTLGSMVLVFGLCALACEKEETRPAEDKKEDAGSSAVDKAAQIDPSLAKAVAAASANAPQPQAGEPEGPPPSGVFAPGQADKEIKRGEPAKLTLGSEGQAPRYQLRGSSFRPGTKVKGTIQVAVQTDPRQGALPVDFNLTFQAKPAPAEMGAGVTQVVATVDSATVQAVGLPPEIDQMLKALKGSRIEYTVAANGAGGNFTPVPAKGADAEQPERWLRALNDALATITLPFPDKPVGTGAFWMATSREGVMGLDLVSYRMVRVQRAEPTQVTLTIETKRYAAGTEFDVPGLVGDYSLEEFQSMAEGTAMLAHGQPLPHKSLLKLNLIAGLKDNQKPDQRGTLAIQGQARFTFDALQDPAGQVVKSGAGAAQPAVQGQPQPGGAAPAAPAQPAPAQPAEGAPAPAAPQTGPGTQ